MSWSHNTEECRFTITCDQCGRSQVLVTRGSAENSLRLFTAHMGWKRSYVSHAKMHLNQCKDCVNHNKKYMPKPTKLFTRAEWRTIVLLAAMREPRTVTPS